MLMQMPNKNKTVKAAISMGSGLLSVEMFECEDSEESNWSTILEVD